MSHDEGKVVSIRKDDEDVTWIRVEIDGEEYKGVNYKELTGEIDVGDRVALNTTAMELSLGTGGEHFVMYNFSNRHSELSGEGHIMKLRYTPYQTKYLSVEEQDSEHHEKIKEFESLNGHNVILGNLHSMLGPIGASIKYLNEDLKITYIMTDDAALPLAFSRMVKELKDKNIIDNTITVGQAFGGDYECVNLYTGLITSKEVLKSDITIVTMGPGIVGTGTKYGFSGIEQGHQIDTVNNLGGKPIIVPRISFADERERHQGVSHHTLTVLSEISNTRGVVILPKLDEKMENILFKQLNHYNIGERHDIIRESGDYIDEVFQKYDLKVRTMGRGLNEDREFFKTLGGVARYVVRQEV